MNLLLQLETIYILTVLCVYQTDDSELLDPVCGKLRFRCFHMNRWVAK